MIVSTPTSAVVTAPTPTHSTSGGVGAIRWLVVPFLVVVTGFLLARTLRRR